MFKLEATTISHNNKSHHLVLRKTHQSIYDSQGTLENLLFRLKYSTTTPRERTLDRSSSSIPLTTHFIPPHSIQTCVKRIISSWQPFLLIFEHSLFSKIEESDIKDFFLEGKYMKFIKGHFSDETNLRKLIFNLEGQTFKYFYESVNSLVSYLTITMNLILKTK